MMMPQQYPSELLEKAVQEFSKLPGIGRKTALRLVLNLLRREEDDVLQFTETIARMRQEVKHCRVCHNISDSEVCPLCGGTTSVDEITAMSKRLPVLNEELDEKSLRWLELSEIES